MGVPNKEAEDVSSIINNKLELVNQRYKFKEEKSMDAIKEAQKLVDTIFDEGFEVYSKIKAAEKELTKLLDNCGIPGAHSKKNKKKVSEFERPYDHPLINKMGVEGENEVETDSDREEYDTDYQSQEENPQKVKNDINHVPNQDVGGLLKSVHDELAEMLNYLKETREEYQKFFKSMMAKHGIKNMGALPPEKKKAFFNAVDKAWKAKNEARNLMENEAYKKHFRAMMAKHGVKNIGSLSPEKKKEFFNAVDKSWKAKKE